MADRRPRRTWWIAVGTRDGLVADAQVCGSRTTAQRIADFWERDGFGKHEIIRVVELRPGERVIESPGGRGKRGRRKP